MDAYERLATRRLEPTVQIAKTYVNTCEETSIVSRTQHANYHVFLRQPLHGLSRSAAIIWCALPILASRCQGALVEDLAKLIITGKP